MILLQNSVLVFMFLETLLSLMLLIALYHTVLILRYWDFSATTSRQYQLEKRSYLVMLIITFAFGFKIALLPYFAHMLDSLSLLVPGAMCAAGVIGSNSYGSTLLLLKIAMLFAMGVWLILNRMDLEAKHYPYFRSKLWLFVAITVLVGAENLLDLLFLEHIVTTQPVSCCSVIFGAQGSDTPLPFGLDIPALLGLFFLSYLLILVSSHYRMQFLVLAAYGMFLYLGSYALIYFFGTYIYELPTHLCPYCMLQQEYYFIGYLLWGALFLGSFFGMAAPVIALSTHSNTATMYRYGVILITLFMLICSGYVLRYYLINGVLL